MSVAKFLNITLKSLGILSLILFSLFLVVTLLIQFPLLGSYKPSGKDYAKMLIAFSRENNKGEIYLGDSTDPRQRVCFTGKNPRVNLEKFFPNIPIVYQEYELFDFPVWSYYVGFHAREEVGLIILTIPSDYLKWDSDYSGPSETICVSKGKIWGTPNEEGPRFKPDHKTSWRP